MKDINNMNFLDDRHEKQFYEFVSNMSSDDSYHTSMAYLLSLDRDCREHVVELFDFENDRIKPNGQYADWQTGTSIRTTRLAFNLWNAFVYKEDPVLSTPDQLFACELAPYYVEALHLRFPFYFDVE